MINSKAVIFSKNWKFHNYLILSWGYNVTHFEIEEQNKHTKNLSSDFYEFFSFFFFIFRKKVA